MPRRYVNTPLCRCRFPLPAKMESEEKNSEIATATSACKSLVLQEHIGLAFDEQLAELNTAIHSGTMQRR
jgi:hypothetical protein